MNKETIRKAVLGIALACGVALTAAADSPVYPGGEKAMKEFIAANLRYPAPARENGVEGVINLRVTINADGTVGDVKVVRMVDPDLEKEAVRIVKKMPAWTPAVSEGEAVAGVVAVAVPFVLD